MRKSTQAPRTARVATDSNSTGRIVAMITLTQIVKTHVPLTRTDGHSGMTYGEILDAQLLMAAHEGRIIQDINFGFEEGDWNDYAENLRDVNPHYETRVAPTGWDSTEG